MATVRPISALAASELPVFDHDAGAFIADRHGFIEPSAIAFIPASGTLQ